MVTPFRVNPADSNTLLGTKVTKGTADTIDTSAVSLFTVSGGRVLMTAIYGEVTTIIQAQATTTKLQFNPTTGTTNDMCANLDINADEVGALYSITGTPGDAMLRSESGAVRNMTANGMILDVGAIEQISGAASSGSIQWTMWYIPLDSNASVTAA
jgi:flavoprotein